jgi:hypothetical protein
MAFSNLAQWSVEVNRIQGEADTLRKWIDGDRQILQSRIQSLENAQVTGRTNAGEVLTAEVLSRYQEFIEDISQQIASTEAKLESVSSSLVEIQNQKPQGTADTAVASTQSASTTPQPIVLPEEQRRLTEEERNRLAATSNENSATFPGDEGENGTSDLGGTVAGDDEADDAATAEFFAADQDDADLGDAMSSSAATSSSGGISSDDPLTPPSPEAGASQSFRPLENVLHEYATYTYNLSLQMLDVARYNALTGQSNPTAVPDSGGVLIASAGRRNDTIADFKRNKYFEEDFYFENLKMTTVMGLNARNKGTNAVNLEFTVIEPYGISFLDRLIEASTEYGVQNYIAIPYLLTIDFFGYQEPDYNPSNPIPLTSRKIPIRLLSMNVNFDQRGTVYQFTAVPYGHLAFSETNISLPTNVKIKSNGTLGDFFSINESEVTNLSSNVGAARDAEFQREVDRVIAARTREIEESGDFIAPSTIEKIRADAERVRANRIDFPKSASAIGLGSVLKVYNEFLLREYGLVDEPTKFQFLFHESIRNSKINIDRARDKAHAPMSARSAAGTETQRTADSNEQTGLISSAFNEANGREISFNQGTSIVEIINTLMTASDYIQDQLKPAADAAAPSAETAAAQQQQRVSPYDHFKIVPEIKLGKYDDKRSDYSKTIVFHVIPYKYHGIRYPYINRNTRPRDMDCVKEYNYLYTGKNRDIIDLKINFDTMFYTAITAKPSRLLQEGSRAAAQPQSEGQLPVTPVKALPAQLKFVPNIPGSSNLSQERVEALRAVDLMGNLYSRSQADMLAFDMEIVGDPAYIQQEEFTIFPNTPTSETQNPEDSRLTRDGSLYMNNNNLLVKINFKLPTDIDTENTGLYKFSVNNTRLEKESLFTGIYKILTVDSVFERGVFTQKLNLIRVHNDANAIAQNSPATANPPATSPDRELRDRGATAPDATLDGETRDRGGRLAATAPFAELPEPVGDVDSEGNPL